VTRRLYLDTSSLMYRAFFALPDFIKDAEGKPINAVHGYLDMVARLVQSREPDEVVHNYDHDWRPAPRVASYAGYKAQRAPDPEGLPEQFGVLRKVLDAFGHMTQAEAEGWEAEDAIGTQVAGTKGRDRADIVTGDRDLIMLVRDPHVTLWFTRKGVTVMDRFDEAGVLEKYGVPASRYAEFAILRGDPSDGLPGVKGVGEKTARTLILAYPSLDALIEDANAPVRTGAPLQRSRALRASIKDAADYLRTMQEVVPIRRDLEVRTWGGEPDPKALAELAERYKLTNPIKRLTEALSVSR
jgi:5'-3' exonuclease